MKKATKNKLILGLAAVGGYMLFRQAQAKNTATSAQLGLAGGGGRGGGGRGGGRGGGGRGGGGGHHHHHHGGRGGGGFGPGWWGGGWGGDTVYVIDSGRCVDSRTGLLMPPEYCGW